MREILKFEAKNEVSRWRKVKNPKPILVAHQMLEENLKFS
jgi:hypothetical protein